MHCCLLKLLLKGRGLGGGCRAKAEREEAEGRNRSKRKEGRGKQEGVARRRGGVGHGRRHADCRGVRVRGVSLNMHLVVRDAPCQVEKKKKNTRKGEQD